MITIKGYRFINYQLFLAVFFLFLNHSLIAQTQTVKQLEAQRKAALEDIELTTQLLNETSSTATSSLNRLNLISNQVLARKKVISLLNQEIAAMDKEINALDLELAGLQKELEEVRGKYIKTMQNMYLRLSSQNKWVFVLSANSFAQSIRRIRYLREYSDWRKRQGELIHKKQEVINAKQLQLEKNRSDKQELLSSREAENKQLQIEEGDQRKEVDKLKKKQKQLQTQLSQKKKQAEALNKQIEKLIADQAASSGKASGTRKAESTGGYAMTKEEQQLSSDFASNRGRLPFPLTGRYKIVSPFGEHQHPEWKHVRVNNNGIDIQTTAGTEAQAVFGGVVTSVFILPGYNHGIIVRHGNYLTIYANLSEAYVSTGDKVTRGQKLGKIYTDIENDNTTILHFEVRKEKEKMDPELWLD